MKQLKFPRLLLWMVSIGLIYLVFMTVMRFGFFYYFKSSAYELSNSWEAFLLGLNYDLRIVCGIVLFPFLVGNLYLTYSYSRKLSAMSWVRVTLTALVMVALLLFMNKGHMQSGMLAIIAFLFLLIFAWLFSTGNCNPFENKISRRIFRIYFFIITLVLVLFYVFDFQHYDYLHQRLSASILNFAGDAKISADMIWQTYPVFALFILIVLFIVILYLLILHRYRRLLKRSYTAAPTTKFFTGLIFALLLGLGIFGKINQYPLRWSDAFALGDDFKANIALNPVQSFFSTLQYRNSGYNIDLVKKYYPLMTRYLNVENPDPETLNYRRSFTYPPSDSTPNVVIVICESFSMYKSSMSGNALNTTPYFDSLSRNGIFFDRCFTPAYGTARGIWATLTGIPDVQSPNTASRNPAFVDQHSIINNYDGYEKFYFIGGSSSWANIRGLLTNNLENIQLYEEENFKAESVDVWGISDKRLFLAANKRFSDQDRPFIGVIQTADNHRPYTIPEEDRDEFTLIEYPKDTLEKYGFESNAELNAFRYSDFAFRTFLEAAEKEDYFSNTIFAFVGDHGLRGYAGAEFPEAWQESGLTIHHVPLLFYAPELLPPRLSHRTCSQVDLLPSVTALAGVSFVNTTMGRNLMDTLQPKVAYPHNAFIFDPTIRQIGMVTDRYVYTKSLISGKEQILSSLKETPGAAKTEKSAHLRALQALTEAWYETANYMLFTNKKSGGR